MLASCRRTRLLADVTKGWSRSECTRFSPVESFERKIPLSHDRVKSTSLGGVTATETTPAEERRRAQLAELFTEVVTRARAPAVWVSCANDVLSYGRSTASTSRTTADEELTHRTAPTGRRGGQQVPSVSEGELPFDTPGLGLLEPSLGYGISAECPTDSWWSVDSERRSSTAASMADETTCSGDGPQRTVSVHPGANFRNLRQWRRR